MLNFEREGKLGGNWQQLRPASAKMALCPSPKQLRSCVAEPAALASLCVQEGLGVLGTGEAASPEEAALTPRRKDGSAPGK